MTSIRFIVLLLMCLLASLWVLPANAQSTASSELTESLKPLIEQAKKEGATIMIIAPGGKDGGAEAAVKDPTLTEMLSRARFRLRLVLKGAGEFFDKFHETIAKQSPQGTGWLFWTVLVSIGAIIVGRLVAKPVAIWTGNMFTPRVRDVPHTRSYKLSLLLFSLTVFGLIAGIAGLVAAVIVVGYAGDDEAVRTTGLIIIACYIGYRMVRGVSWNFFGPSRPAYRPFYMPDDLARRVYNILQIIVGIGIAMIGLCLWMFRLGLDDNAHKLALICATGVIALMLSVWAIRFRQPVAQAFLGEHNEGAQSWWMSKFAHSWHVLVVLYMGVAWFVSSIRILLDLPNGPQVVGDPIIALFVCVVGYCIALIVIDKFLGETWLIEEEKPEAAPIELEIVEAVAEPDVPKERLVIAQDDDDNEFAMPQVISEEEPDKSVPLSAFKPLAEHAAVIVALITGAVMTAAIWGVDFDARENIFVRFIDIIIVAFIAYISYRAVNVWVAEKRALEGDYDSAMPDEEMMGGGGASRFLTLLPMFRNFLLITIVVIGGMMILSELGVDIGPLFAGAGVIGLAIGFGAQTLIRDVFSGAFFLIDDAFRKGEYIDIGDVKGTVEKISIRSFQLRHHRGALNTVPFGEIKQITNYSRDWVMMKLPIRVTYDTDLEMLRKLVKRLGIELLEDEDIGAKFLQPLKSQGALEMGDSAIIIRLKFMTRPGDQFSVRTKVLTKIRELFEANGIKFAHREVTVRVAQAGEVAEMSGAIAGAAASAAIAAEEEQKQQQHPSSGDKL